MSDEVSNFLRSVEQLKDRRLEEDEARSRELEERILQDKRERQARRAERARSISPQKSSPANTPPPPSSHHRYNSSQTSDVLKLSSSPPVLGSPRSPTARTSQQHSSSNGNGASTSSAALASALDYSAGPSSSDAFVTSSSPTKENEAPFDADNKALSGSSIGRTPTLSWQRRPPSGGQAAPDRSSRSRPLSVVAAENAAARSSIANSSVGADAGTPSSLAPEPKDSDTPIPRDQIAQALSAKDPSWFRQTADRGANSAAYRRSQVEDEDRQDLHSASARLPGLSRETSAEPDAGVFSSPPPPAHAAVLSALSPSLQASISEKTKPALPLTPTQKLDPPRESIISPPSGRTSPTRPLSPTKGAGGFVQSAMMKRSDSVKRWSVTSPPGLQRADSIASSRAALDNSRRPISIALAKPTSRPTSSHGRESANDSRPSTPTRLQTSFPSEEEEPKAHKEAKDTPSIAEDEKKITPPSSPSKTMDPRRWSPTKTSSWLDAALSKSESPKPKMAPLPNNQPAWMVELNKAKAQKTTNPGAADATPTPTPPPVTRKHEVKTGGLMRSGPMGTAAATPSYKPSASISSISGTISGKPTGLGITSALPKESTPPPKPDVLRASLKPRQPLPQEKSDGNANELQNVFGTLRRTKTQNYVAPDVLKDNITRGKSALNVTGGPKPREKKDELKDAIMQKKADFNQAKSEGRGIATNAHASNKNTQPIPEGMAKRLELNKTGGSVSSSASGTVPSYMRRDSSPSKPAADLAARLSGAETARFSRSSTASTLSGSSTTEVPDVASPAAAEPVSSPPVQNLGPIGRSSPKIGASGSGGSGGSALASRFNPALAGMLARGPPGMASGGGSPVSDDATTPAASTSSSIATEPPPGAGPQLTHMTKNRARGPRRKAPSSIQQAPAKPSAEEPAEEPAQVSPVKPAVATPKKLPPPTTPKKADIVVPQVVSLVDSAKKTAPEPSPKPASVRGSPVISLVDSSRTKVTEERSTPSKANVISLVDSSRVSKSPEPRSPVNIRDQVAAIATRNSQSVKPTIGNKPIIENKPAAVSKLVEEPAAAVAPALAPGSQPSSPRKIDVKRMSKFLEQSANQPPVVSAPVEIPRPLSPSKTGGARPLPVPRPLSPQKTGGSARPLPVAPISPKKNEWQPTSPPAAGAAGVTSPASFSSSISRRSKVFGDSTPVLAASSPQQTPKSPATSIRLEPNSPAPLTSPPLSSPLRSPTKQAQEVSVVLNDFFGADRPSRTYRVDTVDILSRRPQTDIKIKTLSAQLYRVTEDGKKQPVPTHYERILFEREMYLCPHTFTENTTGKKVTEVYFWAGDDVPRAMIQDAQAFLTREARAVGGKLLQLQQGKETAEFLLALGGIVTIRRGSSNKFDSLASSMFCGRQHLGQIVFDEVDFETSSLCSGFPYLITRQGKCYLWKGKGSNVNELSCARLIGMDLALMGELAEVEDGKESANFWALFEGSGRGKPGSADHWRLKPKYDRYAKRLFCFNASQREQIVEIHPFDQRDLSPDGIYVLDAFFEMYIIVGRNSQAQYAAFRNALDFSQEYAILAAGMEDRPFVPISTVVLEGIPRDLKSVFRKWAEEASPTRMAVPAASAASSPAASIKRGRSLRIVPLTVALQAVAE
ncbi:hypothetical protein SCUCBS95973_003272 [Sporothrix curviconia]|uniref:Gelsolin repeat protein n=1 Tax=Sporothrix curviconia TaxID=1260050 RepID=A0ABP0BEZ0_9PEZI